MSRLEPKANMKILIICTLLIGAMSMREQDLVANPPGMQNVVIYSGFLNTTQQNRRLHYVFVQAESDHQKAPLTMWLNGGPGCSSLIGFMQEVGPYKVGDSYTHGDNLTLNPHRWNKVSNMLFVESPGIVGFSTDTDQHFPYNDEQTADDSFAALLYFFKEVGPQFANNELFFTGESYAGKYIPDLTTRVLAHNRPENSSTINLKGILVGNGVMNFQDDSLTKFSILYMAQHDFLSERLYALWRSSCEIDYDSPRCKYFRYEFSLLRKDLNHYNVYEVCTKTPKSIQAIRMQEFIRQAGSDDQSNSPGISLKNINYCPSDQGMIDYLNLNKAAFHVFDIKKDWEVCSDLKYTKTPSGSLEQYRQIFLNKGIKVWLFNGDWDDVVPYPDTEFNLKLLKRSKSGAFEPWFVGEHHAGFYQVYDSLNLITVKGASHMVPQTKPEASYQMFYNFIHDRPINTPV